jgi:GTPase Era involved in 16S rRNA processing
VSAPAEPGHGVPDQAHTDPPRDEGHEVQQHAEHGRHATAEQGAVHGAETAALTQRVDALRRALDEGGDRVAPEVAASVRRTLDSVAERLALGVDHTVVALVGGTGSGKSSLFNAVSGLEFADVGVRRPTTSDVTACVWGSDADDLLDWLGVARDRRIQRESALDAEDQAALRGLILLDLPDHDSIAPEHRATVDRLIPQTDLLAWVVDPQKYADDSLHSGYLQRLTGREAAMLVVLNQIDTVPPHVRVDLLTDVGRLLQADGLPGVPVREASARTGEGIPALREMLAKAVAARSYAATRTAAEVTAAAEELRGQVADREPPLGPSLVNPAVEALAVGAGLHSVAQAAGAATRDRGVRVPLLGDMHEDAVVRARARWLDTVGSALPPLWSDAVRARVPSVARLRGEAQDALRGVDVTTRRPAAAAALVVAALVALVGAAGLVTWGLVASQAPAWTWAAAGAAAVLAVVLWLVARGVRARAARRRYEAVVADGRAALTGVVRRGLLEPTAQVLAEHRAVREAVAEAAAG